LRIFNLIFTDRLIDAVTFPAWVPAMCARYTLTLEQARLVIAGLVHIFAFAPRYNIGPAQRVPVILDTVEGVKAMEMRWGIPSAWSKTLHINAQAENIHKTTTFKPLLGQRCLVPMDGFYEWKNKSPVRFVRRRREFFCVAGLWKADDPHQKENLLSASTGERIKGEVSKQIARSFVLLTTAANPSVAPIHDRMPFIVRDDQLNRWLDNSDFSFQVSAFQLFPFQPSSAPRRWEGNYFEIFPDHLNNIFRSLINLL
jgi:putative SOS response-associated peptidase YedK